MRLFVKILLFAMVALVVNLSATSAIFTFPDIPGTTAYFSFDSGMVKAVRNVYGNSLKIVAKMNRI